MSTAVQTRIGPLDQGRAMTLEEFRDAEEEPGYRYELARGVVEVVEVPNDPHGQIEHNLMARLYAYRERHPGLIRRIGGASAFRLWIPAMISGRNPDVAIVLEGTPKDARGRRPPSWAAEVVSSGGEDRDYRVKRDEYWVFGLREYWIVDPASRRATVLIRDDADLWRETTYGDSETIASALLPGLELKVDDLWIDAELDDEGDPR